MPGAYVAKPDAVVSVDVPPGWDLSWPFPGPLPPGYSMSLAFVASGPESITPGEAASGIEFKLTDHDEYPTSEPPEQLTYTAELESAGTAVGMKFNAEDDFSEYLTGSYSDLGDDFWGVSSDILFDVSVSDVGDTIILTATSTPLGQAEVTQTHEIAVVIIPPTVRIEISADVDGDTGLNPDDGYFFYGAVFITKGSQFTYGEAEFFGGDDTPFGWVKYTSNGISEVTASVSENIITILSSEAEADSYTLNCETRMVIGEGRPFEFTVTVSVKTYVDDVLLGDETYIQTHNVQFTIVNTEFGEIDGSTGEVTVINS